MHEFSKSKHDLLYTWAPIYNRQLSNSGQQTIIQFARLHERPEVMKANDFPSLSPRNATVECNVHGFVKEAQFLPDRTVGPIWRCLSQLLLWPLLCGSMRIFDSAQLCRIALRLDGHRFGGRPASICDWSRWPLTVGFHCFTHPDENGRFLSKWQATHVYMALPIPIDKQVRLFCNA